MIVSASDPTVEIIRSAVTHVERFGEDTILSRMRFAICLLLAQDAHLLQEAKNGVSERAVVHKLAMHLAPLFPTWHVDVEYNRDIRRIKRINRRPSTPDLVVHKRGTAENLLVVEAKKISARPIARSEDRAAVASAVRELGYRFGAVVVFGPSEVRFEVVSASGA